MKTISIVLAALSLFILPAIFAAELPYGYVVGWGNNPVYGCNGVSYSQSFWTTGIVTIAGQVLTNAVTITAGSPRFALLSDGTIFGWGDNYIGRAIGSYLGAQITNGLVQIKGTVLSNVIAIAAGSLALKKEGTVVGWGIGGSKVSVGLSNIVAISDGLALKNDGTVIAWGTSGHFEKTTVPSGLSNVTAVVGGLENLALKKDGTVLEWYGNSRLDHSAPAGLSNVVAVASGLVHHLALKTDGTVFGWGDGDSPPMGLGDVVAIAAGGENSMALKRDGTVVTWGFSPYHRMDVPAGLSNVVAIAVGDGYCLAITTNRAVAERFRQK